MVGKKQAKGSPDICPSTLAAMKKALKTPRSQWITGTHADVERLAKASRKKK